MFNSKKKNFESVPTVALIEATRGASLDPDAFKYDATNTVKAYLLSVYSQNISSLPNNKVTEEMFYKTRALIEQDKSNTVRTCTDVTISDVKYSGFDSTRYSVKSFSYDMTYTVKGFYGRSFTDMFPYDETRTDTFTLINDARLGFILAEHISV